MDKINAILKNKLFQDCIKEIKEAEKSRKFCRHDLRHFLDVARIAYILNLEKNYKIDKDIIYAAALLHDLGRCEQYRKDIPHEKASAEIAENILCDCSFNDNEMKLILDAILHHRKPEEEKNNLSGILYISDKISRECFCCDSAYECKWPHEKLNLVLKY